MDCLYEGYGICLIKASGKIELNFFGFAEFIGAFALLAIVFTIADVQYRFRISISPLPLSKITFWAIGIIGLGTLLTDIWVSQGWLVVHIPYMTYGVIQGLFATGFLTTAMAWLYFAFLKPPLFSKWNAKKYGQVLFNYLLRGSDSELPIIAMEVSRSADQLIETFANNRAVFQEQQQRQKRGEKIHPNPGNYASDIMWMIGNRKFCRHVIASSPGTAIRIFQAATNQKVYDAPIGQFAKNLSSEAIHNPDSNLYHEESRYQSGLFGELKPFTKAIYGSYRLVESLGSKFHSSPLDVNFELTRNWSAPQLEVYARAALTTYEDRLNEGLWYEHSYSLTRAFGVFKHACWDVYKLDGVEDGDPDIRDRLEVCVRFVTDLIELLEKYEDRIVFKCSKPAKQHMRHDIYDQVAKLMSEIIYNAAGVTKPWWPCWNIQHNTVWTNFFDRTQENKTRRIIGFKLRRLIYEEILEFDKYTDLKSFKAARYLGICLNCMGIKLHRNRDIEPLHKVVLSWVRKNYNSLHKNHPIVAEACLMGSIIYDGDNKQLIKTYNSHPDQVPKKDFLPLEG
ncbi:MAG: hypothetical protein HUJ16_08700 [Kangiella sp.]|nr:hypothetical protein [Kangiella sp.]